ncbi:adenylosuccinate lyase [Microbacterium sp. 1P10UB]|uniref:adenylosuccinate lyase n=1 Tax=unclassified Microbacterium TaxID=2609290 RepID=UPI0039A2D582
MPALPPQPLSPLDGRYRAQVAGLTDHLSEAGLNRARVEVEVEWLIVLTDRALFGTSPLSEDDKARLRALYLDFGQAEIDWLADKEAVTRHDVKAVEYLVRDRLTELGLDGIAELTHFACTSEDVNSASYALTVRRAVLEVWLPRLEEVIATLRELAEQHRDAPMLARTHGQPATPTTMGKELAVFAWRLERVAAQVRGTDFLAKFSGATGTWSAHVAAEPDVDWPELSRAFIEGLGIGFNPLTTQIESHDWQVELYDRIRHAGGILHNLATDIWTYISLAYFTQIPVAGATGSSTMPHKINPIRFENAEANLEISGGLLATLAGTLVTSRLQRDLTDSTTQRNIGVALGHSLLALDNLQRGLGEISLAQPVLDADLEANQEVLAEAIQTVVRAEIAAGRSQISDPYALLKDLTRGRRVGADDLAAFVKGLDIGDAARERLLALTPRTYTGLASQLVDLRHDAS